MGIVGVLALALGGLLWRNWNTAAPAPQTTTTLLAVVTTTNSTSTTATTVPSPTTTTEAQRVAEVEMILTDLWLGWFDALFRDDVDALWLVVATTSKQEAGVSAMETVPFVRPPALDELMVEVRDVLLDRPDCLVVQARIEAPFVGEGTGTEGVYVLWPDSRYGWRMATTWVYANDLWLSDCDEMVREETP